MPEQYTVAIVVLNWNGLALLEQFMPSWVKYTPSNAELVIVDNGSTDASVAFLKEHYPNIRRIEFTDNYGFALGYNKAIEILEHPIVVLLNSDATPRDIHWLDEPLRILRSRTDIVAIQPKIRAYNAPESFEYAGAAGGYLDRFGYPFCRGRIFDTIEADMGQYDQVVDDLLWASGASLIIRREAYLSCGGLDARFFAHQEEIDLCWRLVARGDRIALAPSSIVYHIGGASLDSAHPRKTYLNFRNNLLMLYKNMPSPSLQQVFAVRIVLDLVALLTFALTGRWQHALSVYRAHRDFWQMKRGFISDRSHNLSQTTNPKPLGIKGYSLLWRYHAEGKKHYQDI